MPLGAFGLWGAIILVAHTGHNVNANLMVADELGQEGAVEFKLLPDTYQEWEEMERGRHGRP